MKRLSGLIEIGVLSITLAAWGSAAWSKSVEEFYRGRVVEFIVGSDAGNTFDSWARLLAKYLPKYLPGQPTFVVRDMPGAGHIKATNYLYSVAPKDGSSIGIITSLIPTATVLKNKEGLNADFTKFNWIGTPEQPRQVCLARVGAAVQKGEDLFTETLTVGGAGAGSGITAIATFLRDVLGMKFNIVEGYKSAFDVMLAIERAEVDGICQTYQGVQNMRPDWIATGKVKLLFNIEKDPIPGTDVPSVHSLIKTEEQRQTITFYSLNAGLGRPIIAPPEVPKERMEALRQAFDAAMADPELLREATQEALDPSPLPGAKLQEMFQEILATPPEVIARTAHFL